MMYLTALNFQKHLKLLVPLKLWMGDWSKMCRMILQRGVWCCVLKDRPPESPCWLKLASCISAVFDLLPRLLWWAVLVVVGVLGTWWVRDDVLEVYLYFDIINTPHPCCVVISLVICLLFGIQALCCLSEASWTTPECVNWLIPLTPPFLEQGYSSSIKGKVRGSWRKYPAILTYCLSGLSLVGRSFKSVLDWFMNGS